LPVKGGGGDIAGLRWDGSRSRQQGALNQSLKTPKLSLSLACLTPVHLVFGDFHRGCFLVWFNL
jgi:hypothetical protein